MYQVTMRQIEDRYDADNDFVPGQPVVSWTDRQLLEVIKELAQQVEELEAKVSELTDRAK